jgi:alpha/beta superfamily hydrolase
MKNILILYSLICIWGTAFAQNKASEGLKEKLYSINLNDDGKVNAVLSQKEGSDSPTVLVVLLPGHPAVVRAEIENGKVTKTSLNGNFLIRARRHLISKDIATLILDCRTSNGFECSEIYMASSKRFEDLRTVLKAVRSEMPSISKVWLMGTRFGTVTSSHLPKEYEKDFVGVINTSTINFSQSYQSMNGLKYDEIKIPQVFIHHELDNCIQSKYAGILEISKKYKIPLYTIAGEKPNSDQKVSSNPCEAFTPHGFRGIERDVMLLIQTTIMNGIGSSQKFTY